VKKSSFDIGDGLTLTGKIMIITIAFLFFFGLMFADGFTDKPCRNRIKYIDDNQNGVIWIVNDCGDTLGTV
jgi:hypothetical protein